MNNESVHLYTTLIKNNVSRYVHGVIFGLQYSTCGIKRMDAALNSVTGDILFEMACTESQYEKFKELVQELYPDTCEFDYQYEDWCVGEK